jgi:imidazole glycerol phosphate synthase subunit HisF
VDVLNAQRVDELGADEIVITVDKEGTGEGFDELIAKN